MNRHTRKLFKLGALRLLALTVISFAVVFAFSEISFILQKDPGDRLPAVIELYIPEGTADKIAAGEKVASIPAEMNLVMGDVLVIHNNDSVQHQLGPLFIPARSSASLAMDTSDSRGYTCSFQQTRFMGMDVRQATTTWTRLQGLLLAAPATAVFLFVYSIILFPLEKKPKPGVLQEVGEPK